jgi:hypothetical protein
MNNAVAVRYVGSKPIKRDTVTNSLAVWVGTNSVCEVPADVAVKLFLHPDVWQPADAPVLERPAPARDDAEGEGDDGGEPFTGGEDDELREDDEHGIEKPPAAEGEVTVQEVIEILPLLDREADFTEGGKPAVAKVRERFPERELTVATVRAAWDKFSGA